MNKEEMIAHFKERENEMTETMNLLRGIDYPISALAQLICAISYDIALMAQYQLEREERDNQ